MILRLVYKRISKEDVFSRAIVLLVERMCYFVLKFGPICISAGYVVHRFHKRNDFRWPSDADFITGVNPRWFFQF